MLRLIVVLCAVCVAAFSSVPCFAAGRPTHPIILIPGILGSRLCDSKKDPLWGDNAYNSFRRLPELDLSRVTPKVIHSCGIVTSVQVLGPLYSVAAYSGLIRQFQHWNLVSDRDCLIFNN